MPLNYFTDDKASILYNPLYILRSALYSNLKRVAATFSGTMLDYGCGNKPYKKLFPVDHYVGVDIENEAHPHDAEVIEHYLDGGRIPLGDNHFDNAICSEVLEHVFDLDLVLSEINRVLKPGGRIIITAPFVWQEHEVPYDFARYSSYGFAHALKEKNFEIIEHRKLGNSAEVIIQLFLTKYYDRVVKLPIKPLRMLLLFPVLGFWNGMVALFRSKKPRQTDLFLNHFIVARKIGPLAAPQLSAASPASA